MSCVAHSGPGLPMVLSCARSSWRMLRFVKDYALNVHLTYKDDDLFRNGSVYEWQCLKTCKMSKVHARSHEIANKPLRVPTTKTLWLPTWKQTVILRSVPQMLKKWRIVVNRISKVRQTACNWIKKILDEATRIVNVFLISWFFYCFYYVH